MPDVDNISEPCLSSDSLFIINSDYQLSVFASSDTCNEWPGIVILCLCALSLSWTQTKADSGPLITDRSRYVRHGE